MILRELTNQEFTNFTNNFNVKSIYQTPEYGFVMNNQKYESLLLGLINNDVVIAASLILVKKESGFKYAYAPRGFVLKYDDFYLFKEFTEQIKSYLNTKGIIAIKINPLITRNVFDFDKQTVVRNEKYDLILEAFNHYGYFHLGYNNFFESLKPRFEAIIDLSIPINTLFKNVKKEYRTKIRSALKNGIEVRFGNVNELDHLYSFTKDKYPRDLDYFKDCFGYFSKTNKIDYFYTLLNTNTYLKNIQDKLSQYEKESMIISNQIIAKPTKKPSTLIDKKMNIDKYVSQYKNELINATKLLRTYPTGIITSAMIVIKHGSEATILIDGYDKKFQKFNSKHLLIWELITLYKKQGYVKFNLGGVSNHIIDLNKYYGLNDFKINFGAKMYEYIGDFELIINKRNYNLYRNYVPLKNLIKSKLIK